MNEPIVLHEYESVTATLNLEQVTALRALAKQRLSIVASDIPGDWIIKATAHVGTLVTGEVRVLVRPKVSDANLFHLLEAGGDALEIRPEAFEYEQTSDIVPSFATFFARVVEAALGRGIHRSYEDEQEALFFIRGRIDVAAQVHRLGLSVPIECRFDEFTADTALNRIVKAAAERLVRLRGVTSPTRSALMAVLARLTEASPLRDADLVAETLFTRLNVHYRPAERLARMVLRSTSLVDQTGDAAAGVFLVNMNAVFEEFVEARLRSYLSGRYTVVGQHTAWLDVDHRVVKIRPDLVVKLGRRAVFVGDAKYKLLHDVERGTNPDYYQLLAYATALNVPEGVLVYCHHEGIKPEPIVVENAGTRLHVRGINLDGSPSDVDDQLRDLADWISLRCADLQGSFSSDAFDASMIAGELSLSP